MSPFTSDRLFRVYLCRCGQVHIETRNHRVSLTIKAFHEKLELAWFASQEVE